MATFRCPSHKPLPPRSSLHDKAVSDVGVLLEPSRASSASARVFGVEHLTLQPAPGRYILEAKPDVVVVETAVSPTHGAVTGGKFSCGDEDGFVARTVCGVDSRMRAGGWDSELWGALEGNLPGEQLVYVAALQVGAELVFGDRSKSETFVRVVEECSLEELDVGFGEQARANYQDLLRGGWIRARSVEPARVGCAESVMLLEREATLCKTLWEACERVGSDGAIVGVVGAEHVNAMVEMWNSRKFEEILEKAEERRLALQKKKDLNLIEENSGIKYALLESLVTQSASEQVLVDLKNELGEVPEKYQNDYWFTTEMYASTRMLLACLPEDELKQVCCGWRCDMWEVLEKYRAARPCNGATAVDLDIITELRGLEINIQK